MATRRLGAKQDSNENNNQNQLPGTETEMNNELSNQKPVDVEVLFESLLTDYKSTKEGNESVIQTVQRIKDATAKLNQEFESKLVEELNEIKEMNDINNAKVNLILSDRISTMLESKQANQNSILEKANNFKARFDALVG